MNRSKQRDTILNVLRSTTSHPTAEWIYNKARMIMPNISLGTVYRNLNSLVETNAIIRVQGVFYKDRYDGNPVRHTHLVCNRCGSVVDIEQSPLIDKLLLSEDCGCQIQDYALVYYGLCSNCVAKNN